MMICDRCQSTSITPVIFLEEERKTYNGHMYKTGRVRKAVSHLVCEYCGKNFAVDDSMDGPWMAAKDGAK